MKQLIDMPASLASRIHAKGFVPIECVCGEVFAWDPVKNGSRAVCPVCRREGDPILAAASAPVHLSAITPQPVRLPAQPDGTPIMSVGQLQAFTTDFLGDLHGRLMSRINQTKDRMGKAENRFHTAMDGVDQVAAAYEQAAQQAEDFVRTAGGNMGPTGEPGPPSSQQLIAPKGG